MHQYRQQLFFYKILVDGSRFWGDRHIRLNEAELVFVESSADGEIESLALNLDDSQEQERTKKLIVAVWQRIQNLDFPDVSSYDQTVKGITAFEEWLIDNN
jgi:hypothetical protein